MTRVIFALFAVILFTTALAGCRAEGEVDPERRVSSPLTMPR